MELRQLVYFAAIVEKGTISAAAKSLYLSQPPLSAQLQALERELGVSLFDRSTRRMRLTEAGRALYARAREILDACASVKSEMADIQKGVAGTMHLGVVSSLCGSFLFRWLKDFCAAHSRVRLQLYEADTYHLLEMVRSRQVELAFVRTPFSAPDLKTVAFHKEPLCAAGLPSFLDKKEKHREPGEQREKGARGEEAPGGRAAVTLQELGKAPLILYRRWEQILLSAFQKENLSPDIFCVSDDARTTLSLARAGFGIGVVPRSVMEENAGSLPFWPLRHPDLTSHVCAVYRGDAYMTEASRLFLEEVRGRAGARELNGPKDWEIPEPPPEQGESL